MQTSDPIFVAGHRGLVGSAIVNSLRARGFNNLVLKTRDELDLTNDDQVAQFFNHHRPKVVFLAAAKVGGILANNTYRADFLYENLRIQNNVIWQAHAHDVERLVFLGSSCIYPRLARQPMQEVDLLSGPLEFSNRPYALAKIAGLELVNTLNIQFDRRYFSVMPTNLYGPSDNFHPENSHVLPALIRRFHEAKLSSQESVLIWGSGTPKRELMYSQDCADAIVHLAENVDENYFRRVHDSEEKFFHINVGSGAEVSIAELAELVSKTIDFKGRIEFDRSKPDGTPRKLLDTSLLRSFDWSPKVSLKEGIANSYRWFLENQDLARASAK